MFKDGEKLLLVNFGDEETAERCRKAVGARFPGFHFVTEEKDWVHGVFLVGSTVEEQRRRKVVLEGIGVQKVHALLEAREMLVRLEGLAATGDVGLEPIQQFCAGFWYACKPASSK